MNIFVLSEKKIYKLISAVLCCRLLSFVLVNGRKQKDANETIIIKHESERNRLIGLFVIHFIAELELILGLGSRSGCYPSLDTALLRLRYNV